MENINHVSQIRSGIETADCFGVRSVPRWLRDAFTQERRALENIADPIARRVAEIDLNEGEWRILQQFTEEPHAT